MKKVFIGCAAVLLSLGLLAGCDNEEGDKAVSIKVDNAATVVVGDILELPYTVEPEKAKIEVLNEYEEYVTAEAEDGVLYLEGLSEGDATITLVGTYRKYTEANVNISVSVVAEGEVEQGPGEEEPGTGDEGGETPGPQEIVLSVESPLYLTAPETGETADPVEIEYTVVPEDATVTMKEEDDTIIELSNSGSSWYATPLAEGETTISVTAEYKEYKSAEATIEVTVYEAGTEPEPDPEPGDEKKVTINVDSAATVVAGETITLDYTVDPENAEVVATSDHTEYVTAEATDGVLSLKGVAEGSATVALVGTYEGYTSAEATVVVTVTAVEPEPEPEEKVVSITVDSTATVEVNETTTISYTVDPTDATVVATSDHTEYVTATANNGTLSLTGVAAGEATVTLTGTHDDYTSAEATVAVTVTAAESEPEPITGVTLSITLKYQSQTVTSIPEYEDLYILGTWKNENMDSLDDAELLTQGEGCVFTLSLQESLKVGEWYNYKIYAAYTEASGQEVTLEWSHCLYSSGQGYFEVTDEVVSDSTLNLVAEIEVDPTTILGDPSVGPFTNYTIHFYFTDISGETYYELPSYADAYLTGDLFPGGNGWTYGADSKLTAGTDASGHTYYSYTFSEIEAGAHTLAIYFEYNSSAPDGAQGDIPSWQHQYSSNFEYVVESSATSSTAYDYTIAGGDPADVIPVYAVPDDDPDTFKITIVTKDTGGDASKLSALYITGGDASGEYYNSHYTMSGTSGTNYSSMGEFYYTFANWDKQTNLEFCIHYQSGNSYWQSSIIPSTNVTGTDNNYQFWTYNNGSSTSYMGFSLSNMDRMSLVGIDELILVLSFDYSAINTSSSQCYSLAMTSSVTAVSTAS